MLSILFEGFLSVVVVSVVVCCEMVSSFRVRYFLGVVFLFLFLGVGGGCFFLLWSFFFGGGG